MRSCHLLFLVVAACGHEASHPITSGSGSAPPVATTGPIDVTAAASHGVLSMSLRNTTAAPITIAANVFGGHLPNYDWLTVTLDGGAAGVRTFHFMSDREESGVTTAAVAPGTSHVEQIDLVQWAIYTGNGGPLLPGTYQLTATWDTSAETHGAKVVATATTTLVVEPPGPENCAKDGYKAPADAKLMLLGHQSGPTTIDMGLYNVGPATVCVDSYIHTHELQYDWFNILYADGAKYHHASRVIHLDDARDKSYPVSVLLGPGQTIWHSIDVDAWARRDRNGKEPLPTGSLYTQITYDSTRETDVWAGKLLSASFGLDIK